MELNRIPKVAVVLAAFNGIRFIEQQIRSILMQNSVNIQLFISIDKSSDGTDEFLINWAVSENRIKLLSMDQFFGSAALNFYRLIRDVDLTGFDYLAFSDQDDIWNAKKITNAISLLTLSKASGYSSNCTAFWPSGKISYVNKASSQKRWDYLFESPGPGCTFVLDSDLALSLQKYVKRNREVLERIEHHDLFIYAYSRANKFTWIIDKWPSMQYRQHENNQIGVNVGLKALCFRVVKVLTGYGFFQSTLIANSVERIDSLILIYGLNNSRFGYFWLALNSYQCRRKHVDQLWFFCACIIMFLFNPVFTSRIEGRSATRQIE